jgi:hypothetical protein
MEQPVHAFFHMKAMAIAFLVTGSAWAQNCPPNENPGGLSSSAGGISGGTATGAYGNNSTVGGIGPTGALCVPQPPINNSYPTPGVPPATQPGSNNLPGSPVDTTPPLPPALPNH